MMKILAFILVSTLVPSLSQAGACKFEVNEVDKFEGSIRRATSPTVLSKKLSGEAKPGKAILIAHRKGEEIHLEFRLTMGMMNMQTQVEQNLNARKVTLLMDDGTKIDLPVVGSELPQVKPRYGGMAVDELFLVPSDSLDTIRKGTVTAVRYHGAFHRFDADTSGKLGAVIPTSLGCAVDG